MTAGVITVTGAGWDMTRARPHVMREQRRGRHVGGGYRA
jgi:hypothetical protein